MHILHVTPAFFPSLGGVETHVREVQAQLESRGHTVEIFTITPRSLQANKLLVWQQVWQNRQQFFRAERVHVHDVWWWLLPLYPFIARKLFITFHGWEGVFPVRWQAKLHRWLAAISCRGSVHVGDWIREFYWDVPNAVVYGGVQQRLVRQAKHETLPSVNVKVANNKTLSLVFYGRLSRENEIEKYFALLKLLRSQSRQFDITWVGDGPYKDDCQSWGKVTGMIADATNWLENADVVFASSYLAMAEAQARGAVVCALYSNELKKRYIETYPPARALVHGSDARSVASQLNALFARPALQQHKLVLATAALDHMTWQAVTDTYLRLWTSV